MKRVTNTKEFISKAKRIHNNLYTYTNVLYVKSREKVKISCHSHGTFLQRPNDHLSGMGCPVCKFEYISGLKRHTCTEFVNRAKHLEIYQNINYDYTKFIYVNARTKGVIICPQHGEFLKTPDKHLNGQGCPKCSSFVSHGERAIMVFLDKNNILYKHNKTYDDLLGITKNSRLRYDFYIIGHNLLIEYDGQQHFEEVSIKGLKNAKLIHERTVKYDKIKNEYANKNGIELIRIHYKDFKIISEILTDLHLN